MPLPVQKFREIVFQLLYAQDFSSSSEETARMLMAELKVAKSSIVQAREKAERVGEKLEELDQKIREASREYAFERISRVEKTALRLGLFEMFYDPAIPPKVALAEAIRLTRKFGTPESAHFVNALLDHELKAAEQPVSQ